MNEYWRDRLDFASERVYACLLHGIRRQEKEIDCGDASTDSVENAYLAIYNDHPELFYLSSAPQIVQRQVGFPGFGKLACSNSFLTTPIYSSKQIHECELRINEVKAVIKKKMTLQMSDEEKVLLVAEYLVRNTVYEVNNHYNQNAASALCFGRAQCSGISKAFKLLMDEIGIWCISISGDAADEQGSFGPHAWNIVKLSSDYYHVDITFMLGANTMKDRPLMKIYLFYDDDAIAKNHSWDRSLAPRCTDKSKHLNDFGTNSFVVQKGGNVDPSSEEQTLYDRYASLNQLRSVIREHIKNREPGFSFYLDIGMKTPNDIMRAVQNAFLMSATKEAVDCTYTVSVSYSLLVDIEIEYERK